MGLGMQHLRVFERHPELIWGSENSEQVNMYPLSTGTLVDQKVLWGDHWTNHGFFEQVNMYPLSTGMVDQKVRNYMG